MTEMQLCSPATMSTRKPDQVAEQDTDDLAFISPRRHDSKRRTARQAEFRSPRIVLTAVSAHRHDRIVMEEATLAQPWLHSEGRERGHIHRNSDGDGPCQHYGPPDFEDLAGSSVTPYGDRASKASG